MLIKGQVDKCQDGTFTIQRPTAPNFDDYISDLAVMFDTYPTKDDRQLHEVRKAMALIDDLAAVADKLPELPREKDEQ